MVLRHKRDVEAIAEELKVNRRIAREASRPTGTEINLTTETVETLEVDLVEVQVTASGKNTIRRSEDEPDEPGQTVNDRWEQYDVLGAGGKLLASWAWDGTDWVSVELSETYLPLINIGTGTFGELQGSRLAADAIDGKIITGALFRTAAAGRRLQFDTLGLRSFDEAGDEVGRLETRDDGFHFFGDIFTWPTGDMNDPAARFTADLIEFMGGGSPYQQNARLTRQGLTSTARATGSHLLVQHDSGDVSDAEVRLVAKWTKLFPPNAGVRSTTLSVRPHGVFIDDKPLPGTKLAYEEIIGQTSSIAAGGNIVALGGAAALVFDVTVDVATEVVIEAQAYSSTANMQIATILSGATTHNPAVDGTDVGIASSSTARSRLVITLQPGTTTITLGRRSGAASGTVRNPSILVTAL